MGVKQHFMGLQGVSPQKKSPAVRQFNMRHFGATCSSEAASGGGNATAVDPFMWLNILIYIN